MAERDWRLLFTLRDLAGPAGLAACARGLTRAAVRVETGPQFARLAHPSDDVAIGQVWASKLASNPRVFDAPKYRLASASVAADGTCELRIGLTSYREYIGTHFSPDYAALVAEGARVSGENAHLSCALGVETVLLTSDEHVVLLRRSTAVATGVGEYNGPSGHPEPEHAVGGLGADAVAIGAQLWAAVIAETVEETNVPASTLSEPVLIGAMVDERLKPDLIFCTRTSLSRDQVLAAYRAGAPDAWESSGMIAVPPAEPAGEGHAHGWDCAKLGVELTAVTQAAMVCMEVWHELRRDSGGGEDLIPRT